MGNLGHGQLKGEVMKKSHHVFITVEGAELGNIVHNYLKRSGALKDVPASAECIPFDDSVEVCLEYQWEGEEK